MGFYPDGIEDVKYDTNSIKLTISGQESVTRDGHTDHYNGSKDMYISPEEASELMLELHKAIMESDYSYPDAVGPQPEEGILRVPHTPDGESAMIQEMRERFAMLELHTPLPKHVSAFQQLNQDLHSIMVAVANVDEYGCNCVERSSNLER